MEVQVPVVRNAEFKTAYSKFPNAPITDGMICAGYAQGGKDACTVIKLQIYYKLYDVWRHVNSNQHQIDVLNIKNNR